MADTLAGAIEFGKATVDELWASWLPRFPEYYQWYRSLDRGDKPPVRQGYRQSEEKQKSSCVRSCADEELYQAFKKGEYCYLASSESFSRLNEVI